jgi:VIT1/CCC1 family predicted Fe2+/Mn2+ transporter
VPVSCANTRGSFTFHTYSTCLVASQAERDHYRYQAASTSARVVRSCQGEMEREVTAVLGPVGVSESLCQQVAQSLRQVELSAEDLVSDSASEQLRWSKEVGLTAFLLKFGEGLEEVPTKRLFTSAFTIGFGYLVGGLIPLLPYFFTPYASTGLFWSCLLTGIVLLIFGWVGLPTITFAVTTI